MPQDPTTPGADALQLRPAGPAPASLSDPVDPRTQDLIAAIAEGDTSAFAVFYEAWFDRAFDIAQRLTRRDESFCLDVVQDAMIRAVKHLRPALGITTPTDLERWISRVVHTTALDLLRRESRRLRREASRGRDSEKLLDAARDNAALTEQIEWIRAEISRLPETDRHLVSLKFGQDATVREAGATADIGRGAASGRLTRLLRRLRASAMEIFHE